MKPIEPVPSRSLLAKATAYSHPTDKEFDTYDIVLPHYKVPDVVEQNQLIESLRSGKIVGFVYLIFAVTRSSEHYTPYALR